MKNKIVHIAITLFFAVVLIIGGYKAFSEKIQKDQQTHSSEKIAASSKIKVLTGSAKLDFLKDPTVTQILLDNGIIVEAVKSGAFEGDLAKAQDFDAIWPASANIAQDFSKSIQGSQQIPVFSTPLAIATWVKLIPVLEANSLVHKTGPVYEFDLDKAVPLMIKGLRWNQLSNNTVFPVQKSFLVNTPDIRQSATAASYLAALAFVLNGREIPLAQKAQSLGQELAPLITKQGFQEGALAGPFEDYLSSGMGKAPLVLIYESQFLQAKMEGKLMADKHILVYPKPNIVLKHVIVARTAQGKKFAEVLSQNKDIQQIAAKYGFRTQSLAFSEQVVKAGMPFYEILDVVETPSTSILNEISKPALDAMAQ